MGRRSRKRGESTRAERDAARRERALEPEPRRRKSGRPEAPWGSFPLSELIILLGIVLIAWGAFRGEGGEEMLVSGLVIASPIVGGVSAGATGAASCPNASAGSASAAPSATVVRVLRHVSRENIEPLCAS